MLPQVSIRVLNGSVICCASHELRNFNAAFLQFVEYLYQRLSTRQISGKTCHEDQGV